MDNPGEGFIRIIGENKELVSASDKATEVFCSHYPDGKLTTITNSDSCLSFDETEG